jgi:hypothetical protein
VRPHESKVGHKDLTAGTIGCHVQEFILSNNHILANTNLGLPSDLVAQPGPYDGGVLPNDGIAALAQFEPIVFSTTASNIMDTAEG